MFKLARLGFEKCVRLLERWELSEFVSEKTGLGPLLFKFGFPLISGLITAVLAVIARAPVYFLFLALLSAIVLALVIVYLIQLILRPTKKSANRRNPRVSTRQEQVTPAAQASTNGAHGIPQALIIAASVIISVIGYKFYDGWETETKRIASTELRATGVLRIPNTDIHQLFGFNVFWINTGPVPTRALRFQRRFEYPDRALTAEEEDAQFAALDSLMPTQANISSELNSGQVAWFTFSDEKRLYMNGNRYWMVRNSPISF